jgi:sugar/nucleoside kinase (ribokinase family)
MSKKPDKAGNLSNVVPEKPDSVEVAVLGAAAVDWMAHVVEMPPLDGIAFADRYAPFPGGSGGNVAEGLARLGHKVRFLGVLGDDEGGRLLLQTFESAGVDTCFIRIEKGQRSAACFIAVDQYGQRLIFSLGGAATYEKPSDIAAGQMTGVKILYITDAFQQVATTAISRLEPGAKVIFNPGGLMVAAGMEVLHPILECTDILIVSRVESEALTGRPDPEEACQALLGIGPGAILVTLGERGVLVVDGEMSVRVPAVQVDQVVDTTGAGDAFSVGVISGLLEGLILEQAVRLGCAVAAHKVQVFGSRNGLPDRDQVRSWVKKDINLRLNNEVK